MHRNWKNYHKQYKSGQMRPFLDTNIFVSCLKCGKLNSRPTEMFDYRKKISWLDNVV